MACGEQFEVKSDGSFTLELPQQSCSIEVVNIDIDGQVSMGEGKIISATETAPPLSLKVPDPDDAVPIAQLIEQLQNTLDALSRHCDAKQGTGRETCINNVAKPILDDLAWAEEVETSHTAPQSGPPSPKVQDATP